MGDLRERDESVCALAYARARQDVVIADGHGGAHSAYSWCARVRGHLEEVDG